MGDQGTTTRLRAAGVRAPTLLRSTTRDRTAQVVLACVVVTVGFRLAQLGVSMGSDEGGFLAVGGQWDGAGRSLYTDYWVDRPPLLIAIFDLADSLGGLLALRLIGTVAIVALVLGAAVAGRVAGGPRGARWAAVAATALGGSVQLGGDRVNGEMLAAPFTVWSCALLLLALGDLTGTTERAARAAPGTVRATAYALGAGALAAGAVLIKQSLADAAVFAGVLLLVLVRRHPPGTPDRARVVRAAGAFAVGAVAAATVVVLWAWTRGTDPVALFHAVVTFRLRAAETIAGTPSPSNDARAQALVVTWVTSGLAVLSLLLVVHACWRRRTSAVGVAAAVTVAFGTSLAAMGGSWWSHYLLQPVPAVAVGVGALAGGAGVRAVTAVVAVLAAVATTGSALHPSGPSPVADTIDWVQDSAQPGDTMVAVYGWGDGVEQSDMSSPYPYLWSLPLRVRNPDLTVLARTLAGPRAPTWFVAWGALAPWDLRPGQHLLPVLRSDYRLVTTVCGHRVWLDRGVIRSIAPPVTCAT